MSAETSRRSVVEQLNEELDAKAKRRRAHRELVREMRRLVCRGLKNTHSAELDADAPRKKRRRRHSEHFQNENIQCDSPNAMTPPMASEKLQEIDFGYRETEQLRSSGRCVVLQQVAVISAAGLRLPVLLNVLHGYFKYGGFTFLLLTSFCLFVFAVPLAILELTLGQFTNLPPVSLFARMSKASGGLGFLMMLYRLTLLAMSTFDSRPLHFLLEETQSTVSPHLRSSWKACYQYRDPFCEVLDVEQETRSPNSTMPSAIWQKLKNYGDVTMLPTELYQSLLINVEIRRFSCLLVMCFLAGTVCFFGYDYLCKLSIVMMIAPFVVLPVPLFSQMSEYFGPFKQLLFIDGSYFLSLNAFMLALSVSLQLLSVGEGSWIVIGNRASFHSHVVMPVLITAVVGVVTSFFLTFFGIQMLAALAAKETRSATTRDLLGELHHFDYHQWLNIQYLKYPFVLKNGYNIAFLLLCTLADIPYLVMSLELFLHTMYRILPVLHRLPVAIVRGCLINGAIIVLFIIKQLFPISYVVNMNMNSAVKLLVQFTVANMEVMMVTMFYRSTRLSVNLRSMQRAGEQFGHVDVEKYFVSFLSALRILFKYFCLTAILMGLCYAALLETSNYNLLTVSSARVLAIYVSTCGWIYALHVAIKNVFTGRPLMALFRPHVKWGPTSENARRRADRLDRAARFG